MIVITPFLFRKGDSNFIGRDTFLEETIASIDANHDGVAHIIVDDGSDQETLRALDRRFRGSPNRAIVSRKRAPSDLLSCTNAINFGVRLCLEQRTVDSVDVGAHSHICFLHSDDLALDLWKRIRLAEVTQADFLYSHAAIFFNTGNEGLLWKSCTGDARRMRKRFWVHGEMAYPTMTWSIRLARLLVERHGTMLDPMVGCGEDVDVFLKTIDTVNTHGLNVEFLPDVTAGYRIHEKSLADIRDQRDRAQEELTVMRRHFGTLGARVLSAKRLWHRPETTFPVLQQRASRRKVKVDLVQYRGFIPREQEPSMTEVQTSV